MIPTCPHCGVELGPWESSRGCLTCQQLQNLTIGDRAVRILEGIDQPLPYWDIRRLLRADGGDVWEPSLKVVLSTDLRMCWAGPGTYGLFRHGLLPRVRDLGRVGGIYLHVADCALSLPDLSFVLKYVGYRFRDISLRSAMLRNLNLGIYTRCDTKVFSPNELSNGSKEMVAEILGLQPGLLFDAVMDRAEHQAGDALMELERRRGS